MKSELGCLETRYSLFHAIEEETRYYNCLKTLSCHYGKCRQEIMRRITSNDDVLFYWIIATADFEIDDEEVQDLLLEKIVEWYILTRGFPMQVGGRKNLRRLQGSQHNSQKVCIGTCTKTVSSTWFTNITYMIFIIICTG